MNGIMLAALSLMAVESTAGNEIVVKEETREVTYVADVKRNGDNKLVFQTNTLWEGYRILKRGEYCRHETQKIKHIDVREKLGAQYQVPSVRRNSHQVDCPVG